MQHIEMKFSSMSLQKRIGVMVGTTIMVVLGSIIVFGSVSASSSSDAVADVTDSEESASASNEVDPVVAELDEVSGPSSPTLEDYNAEMAALAECIRASGLRVAVYTNSLGMLEYVVELGAVQSSNGVTSCEDAADWNALSFDPPSPSHDEIVACLKEHGHGDQAVSLADRFRANVRGLDDLLIDEAITASDLSCFGFASPVNPTELAFS
jgi:hypothetical protein